MCKSILRRLHGLGLLMLSLGPPAIIVIGVAITVKLAVDVVQVTRATAGSVINTVNEQVTPRIAAIRAGYEAVAADAARLDVQLSQTFATLSALQDIRIEAGQFGSSPGQHVRIPDNDVWIGPLKIGGGQFADNDLPGISLPSQPVSIPVTPLREAFAPFGQNGVVGQGIQVAQVELGHTVGAVKELGGPIDKVIGSIEGWFAPFTNTVAQLAMIVSLIVAACLVLLLAYVVAGVTFAIRRRAEAGAAYRSGGEIGYVLWVHRTMVLDGIARVGGRDPAVLRPPSPQELQRTIEALHAELRQLRATVEGGYARMPKLAA